MEIGPAQASYRPADFSTVRTKLFSLLVGGGFLLTGGATVAVVAIVVFAPIALYMRGGGTSSE